MQDITLADLVDVPANETRKEPRVPENLETLLASATPGPWKSDGIRIGAPGGVRIATAERLAAPEIEVSSLERNCNAHLMAASRELAELVIDFQLILSDEGVRLRNALANVVRSCRMNCTHESYCGTCAIALSALPKDYPL